MRVGIFVGAVVFMALYVISVMYLGRRVQEGISFMVPEKSRWILYVLLMVLAFSMVFGMLPISYSLKRFFGTLSAYFMGFYAYGLMLFLVSFDNFIHSAFFVVGMSSISYSVKKVSFFNSTLT